MKAVKIEFFQRTLKSFLLFYCDVLRISRHTRKEHALEGLINNLIKLIII